MSKTPPQPFKRSIFCPTSAEDSGNRNIGNILGNIYGKLTDTNFLWTSRKCLLFICVGTPSRSARYTSDKYPQTLWSSEDG